MKIGPPLSRTVRSLIEHELAQPDQLSCGIATMVMARAVLDETYASRLADSCPALGGPDRCRVASLFEREVSLLHADAISLSGLVGQEPNGRWPVQVPWPRWLGTPPWALARSLRSLGPNYRVRFARAGTFSQVRRALAAGWPVPLYVGTSILPRHVTLIIGGEADQLIVYNPARGQVRRLSAAELAAGDLKAAAGWAKPWWVLLPRTPRSSAA